MSRIIGVALLLIILVDSAASHAAFQVSKRHLLKCGCRIFPGGKLKCRSPLLPKDPVKTKDLLKCFCSRANKDKFPELQGACPPQNNFPITLL